MPSGARVGVVQLDALAPAAVFLAALAAGLVYQDMPHGFGSHGEEVALVGITTVVTGADHVQDQASWTSAVASRVWPGASDASFFRARLRSSS